ncbi:DUF2142 domain-containing protein [Microbacterium sp. M4A5_1d]
MSIRSTFVDLVHRHRTAEVVLLALAVLMVLGTGAVFLPIASGADEAAHYIYASAAVRGQAGLLEPMVPERIANTHRFAACIAFHPEITASCQGPLRLDSNSDIRSQTNAGLYNPVFYLWVGLGSLIIPTEYGMYLSRMLAATVTSTFLAWGLSLLRRGATTGWPLVGAALVLTPMTLYVGMVVNPSAWEIATIFCVAVAAYQLFATRSQARRWTEQHTLLLLSGSLLIVTRGLSPLFLLLAATAVVTAVGWEEAFRHLRDRSTQIVLIALIATAVWSVVWVAGHGTYYVGVERPDTLAEGIEGISVFYASYYEQLNQMYGDLGWLDLPSPHILSLVWLMFIGAYVVVAFAVARRRGKVALLIAFASATVVPGVLAGLQWSGIGWQGRYSLPLVATLLIVTGVVADRGLRGRGDQIGPRLVHTLRLLAVGVFAVGTVVMTVQTAHRYSVGASEPWLATPSWLPPIPGWMLIVVLGVGLVAITTFLLSASPGAVPADQVEEASAAPRGSNRTGADRP